MPGQLRQQGTRVSAGLASPLEAEPAPAISTETRHLAYGLPLRGAARGRPRPDRGPDRGRNKPPSQKAANRAHARLRAPTERANAQLKTWRILRKLRCSWRAGQLAKAIHVLQTHEIGG